MAQNKNCISFNEMIAADSLIYFWNHIILNLKASIKNSIFAKKSFKMNKKPELLLPAGNTESFFAALQAGADAVYLGL